MEETVVTIDFGSAINGLSLFALEDSCLPLPLPIENEEIKVAYMHATNYTKSLHALNLSSLLVVGIHSRINRCAACGRHP